MKETKQDASSQKTWVFIWPTTMQSGVGHVAMQIGGEYPGAPEGDYASFHPKWIPAVGPTTILPLPASLSNTLQDDMENEAVAHARLAGKDGHKAYAPMPPAHTYQFEHLDTQAMRAALNDTQKDIRTGALTYQLFPKINIYGFFKTAAYFLSYNPTDHQSLPVASKSSYGYRRDNCATYVKNLLAVGGLFVSENPHTPWGLSPNDMTSQLNAMSTR